MCDCVVSRVHRKMAWSSTMKSNKLQNATGGDGRGDYIKGGCCPRSGGPFSEPDVVSFSPVAFLDFAHLADRRSKTRPFVLVRPLTGKKTKNSRRRRARGRRRRVNARSCPEPILCLVRKTSSKNSFGKIEQARLDAISRATHGEYAGRVGLNSTGQRSALRRRIRRPNRKYIHRNLNANGNRVPYNLRRTETEWGKKKERVVVNGFQGSECVAGNKEVVSA